MKKIKDIYRDHKDTLELSIVALLVLLVVSGLILKSQGPILLDEYIMEYYHSRVTEFGKNFMMILTQLGSVIFIASGSLLLTLYFIRKRDFERLIFLILSTLGVATVNQILKRIIKRTRPIAYFLIKETGYSFPSGHSMGSMAFYSLVFYFLAEKFEGREEAFGLCKILIVGLIGFSRIYLGVHWPSDVLMGFLLGYTGYRISREIYFYLVKIELNKKELFSKS